MNDDQLPAEQEPTRIGIPMNSDSDVRFANDVRSGDLISGKYKALEQIGEGGMGTVWVAEQIDPVRRKVAVKLIKPGMDSKAVIGRFEAERQALALMDHPNIARVLDGGITETGRPYFVMEYVKGIPITQFCDTRKDSVASRLELFVSVCRAIQHAHQKGIIHRDLKPSNILVCLYDGRPVVKVIDFGLAKAMHQPLTDRTVYTAHGVMIGTPLYMSPEQAEMDNLDIDTRSDVYSLGVILYELLTGITPLEKKRIQNASWNDIVRIIRDSDPPRPSHRLSASGSLTETAALRSEDPAKMSRILQRDLDWIVMKALEKERSRRYESVDGFARDIERFLNNEPVEATPPTTVYRIRKWARRNRLSLIVGTVCIAAICLGIAGLVRGLMVAQDAATIAEQQRDKAMDAEKKAVDNARRADEEAARARISAKEAGALADIFQQLVQGSNTMTRHGHERNWSRKSLSETIKEIEASIPRRFEGLPLAEAKLRHFLGDYYSTQGQMTESQRQFEQAVESARQAGPAGVTQKFESAKELPRYYVFSGRKVEGLQLLQSLIEESAKAFGESSAQTVSLRNELGQLYAELGMTEQSLGLLDEQLADIAKTHPLNSPEYIETAWTLIQTQERARDYAAAIRLVEQLIKLRAKEPPANSDSTPTLWELQKHAAICEFKGGNPDVAIGRLESVLEEAEEGSDLYPRWVNIDLECLNAIATIQQRLDQFSDAEKSWQRLISRVVTPNRQRYKYYGYHELCRLCLRRADYSTALKYAQLCQKSREPESSQELERLLSAKTTILFAEILLGQGNPTEAEPLFLRALDDLQKTYLYMTDWTGDPIPENEQPEWHALAGLSVIYGSTGKYPESVEQRLKIANFLLNSQTAPQTAIRLFQEITTQHPDNPWHWYLLTQAELRTDDRSGFAADIAAMDAHFATTTDPEIAARVLYSCLHIKGAFADQRR